MQSKMLASLHRICHLLHVSSRDQARACEPTLNVLGHCAALPLREELLAAVLLLRCAGAGHRLREGMRHRVQHGVAGGSLHITDNDGPCLFLFCMQVCAENAQSACLDAPGAVLERGLGQLTKEHASWHSTA